MAKNNWSREEHILAFNLYCKIPFTKINANYAPVKELAKILNRSNGSVAMKLANFARLDPVLKARNVSGLTQGAKGEEEVWNEFNNNWEGLAYESERILAEYKGISLEIEAGINDIIIYEEGKEREAIVKLRVNQNFFRKTILASYNNRCCITGLSVQELLVAGHIMPWSSDTKNRMNPSNGICMNVLHDKAFDKGLLTLSIDLKIIVSNTLLEKSNEIFIQKYFLPYHEQEIIKPQKFLPSDIFLKYHRENIFIQ